MDDTTAPGPAPPTSLFSLDALHGFLIMRGLLPHPIPDGGAFLVRVPTELGELPAFFRWSGPPPTLEVSHYLPFDVPAERRPAMAEAVCRINYGLRGGAFDLGPDDGKLRFRSTLLAMDAAVTQAQLELYADLGPFWVGRFYLALQDIALAGGEPHAAVAGVIAQLDAQPVAQPDAEAPE